MEGNRRSGTVKWFSRVKGYGFLAPDDEDNEIFVHFTGIEGEGYRNLEKGQRVSFVVEDTDKGPQAVAVRDQGFEATSWTAEPTDEPPDMMEGGSYQVADEAAGADADEAAGADADEAAGTGADEAFGAGADEAAGADADEAAGAGVDEAFGAGAEEAAVAGAEEVAGAGADDDVAETSDAGMDGDPDEGPPDLVA